MENINKELIAKLQTAHDDIVDVTNCLYDAAKQYSNDSEERQYISKMATRLNNILDEIAKTVDCAEQENNLLYLIKHAAI